MSIKISSLIALYLYLDAYLIRATIVEVDATKIERHFFYYRYIKIDDDFRVRNLIGDLRSVEKGTLDETCKELQIRRLRRLHPAAWSADEYNTEFGRFEKRPAFRGADSIAVYDERPDESREIGSYEYLLLPVWATHYKKEIYHVPSLTYVDPLSRRYSIGDGYFGLDDINKKGRPLIFQITKDNQAKLVAYETGVHFSFPSKAPAQN